MPPLTLRIRYPWGQATLAGLPGSMTVAQLRDLIAEETGLVPSRQRLKLGVPPTPLEEGILEEAGIRDRDTITVEEQDSQPQLPAVEAAEVTDEEEEASSPAVATSAQPRRRVGVKRPADSVPGDDVRESELLPAFDRAIAAAVEHAKMLPEDKHQVWALRKAKNAVLANLRQGNNISIGALHTLTGVGHWVVSQVKEHMSESASLQAKRQRSAKSKAAPPKTPNSFTWFYIGRNGKPVKDRNSAECSGFGNDAQFRVGILHSSGREEKAWLPDAKAPPRCPHDLPNAL
mmetsp:Transcript_37782/g.70010  ORF Transcript_37782/g.70010 Transcript_37782/m.70010 type:complete len:289 (-) Transcript_37782:115-981(-)